jgi:hypothetical protein
MQPETQVYSLAPDFGARQETLGPGIHTVRISEMTVGNKCAAVCFQTSEWCHPTVGEITSTGNAISLSDSDGTLSSWITD